MTDERFDQILNEIRDEPVSPGELAAARDRVWQRLTTAPACAELRPEFGAYLAGKLTDARRLLVDDHLARCAECRHVLAEAQGTVVAMPRRRANSTSKRWAGWAVAAGVLVGGLFLSRDRIDAALAPSGPRATVVSVTGNVFRLAQDAVKPGLALGDGELVRTAAGSHAILRLADGSQVEMNERTELEVTAAWSGQTLTLERGDVVIEAAPQGRRRLRVATRDSVATVKGTVFAVSSGAAGSVVSVVEGSVAVSQLGAQQTLKPGQHAATSAALEPVEVRHAISWSQDAEKYYALLAEFSGLEKNLAETAAASVRTQARLLRYLPDGIQVYVAIPNLTGTIRQGLFQMEQRSRENKVLGEWWASDQAQELRATLDRIQAVTPLLGEEVVFVLARDAADASFPLVLAEVQPGRQNELQQALARIADPLGNPAVPYRVTPELLLVSENAQALASMTARLGRGATSPFASEIAQRYQRGVGWLAAVDMTALHESVGKDVPGRALGLASMQRLFFEQGVGGRTDENEMALSFNGIRTGLASWLAPAGAAGSSNYISADAVAVFSASTKDPRQAFEEMLGMLGSDFVENLRKFEAETGVSVSADIAATLGTDFTLAVERPAIPIPGWIAALEVVRPGVLDDTIRRLVDFHNAHVNPTLQQALHITFTQETTQGRTWNSVSVGTGASYHWTYDRGYMIVAMDRATAARAIAVRESGSSLVHSAAFEQRFPVSSGVHHSGFIWINPGGALADLAGLVDNPVLKNLLTSREPVLIVLDAAMEQIRASSRTRLTSLIVDMLAVRGVPSGGGLGEPVVREKRLLKN